MVKKICFVVICLLLATAIACELKPAANLKPVEVPVPKEASEFKQVINEIATTTESIKYLADVPLDSLMPKEWLYEISRPSGQQISVYLAIPIPKELARGMKYVKDDKQVATMYYDYGDKMDPNTDRYIVKGFNLASKPPLIGGPKDWKDYPKLLSLDCFSNEQIAQSPYYIPPEATHGVYMMSGPDFRKSRNDYNISQLLSDLIAANPYEGKGSVSDYVTMKLPDVVKRFREQFVVINKDMDSANDFATALEVKYGRKSGTWTTHDAVESYKKIITDNKAKLSQIEVSLSKISAWDFTSLEKYRSLTTK